MSNNFYKPQQPKFNWWAVDASGHAWFYESKPVMDHLCLSWTRFGDYALFLDRNYDDLNHKLSKDWQNSLVYLGE